MTAYPMTDPGKYAYLFDDLPSDAASLLGLGSGLMIHEFWADAYGVTLEPPPRATVNIRPVEGQLAAIVERDDRPLTVQREPAVRIPTNCRGFTVLAVSMLRAKGIEARSRCGFATYFTDGFFEDHWVAEYFDGNRWKLADAQLDDLQLGHLSVDFDITDVPYDQFVIAGDAWQRFRRGEVDPSKFGLSSIGEAGDWWIAANVLRDAAAVRGVEMLPWDVWEGMPEPGDTIDVAYIDAVAADPQALVFPSQVRNLQLDQVSSFTDAVRTS